MKIIDLTHTIEEDMTVYPGSEKPSIKKYFIPEYSYISVQNYNIEGHIGTHIDTPKHFFVDMPNTENCNLENFYGNAIVLDVTEHLENNIIYSSILNSVDNLNSNNFIIFCTKWYKKWKTESYFKDYPVISEELAKTLASSNIKGVGFDSISVDSIDDTEFNNHKTILGSGKIIIENLTNIESLINKSFVLSCFPLKFNNGDGSPVRAVAIL